MGGRERRREGISRIRAGKSCETSDQDPPARPQHGINRRTTRRQRSWDHEDSDSICVGSLGPSPLQSRPTTSCSPSKTDLPAQSPSIAPPSILFCPRGGDDRLGEGHGEVWRGVVCGWRVCGEFGGRQETRFFFPRVSFLPPYHLATQIPLKLDRTTSTTPILILHGDRTPQRVPAHARKDERRMR